MSHATLDGAYIGCEPGTTTLYVEQNRPGAPGAWEALTPTKVGQWYSLLLDAAQVQLCLNSETRKLEARPKGAIDDWGAQWIIPPDGRTATITDERATVTLVLVGAKLGASSGPAGPLHLEQRGNDFVDANGQRIVLPGVDAFPALRMWRDNGPEALKPFIEESNRLGFTVWRIWSQGSKAQNNFLDLSPTESGYYDSIGPFIDHLNANGIMPLLTGYVDNQDVKSPISHFGELTQRGRGKKALWSKFNQWTKNKSTFDPWDVPSPGPGFIWSQGSDTDDVMTPPRGAPASELHATRNSFVRALMDAVASPPTMREPKNGSGMVWMTEGNPFGDAKGYSEWEAWALGTAYKIYWSLVVFHNRQSQFGRLMNDDTARCASAFVKALTTL